MISPTTSSRTLAVLAIVLVGTFAGRAPNAVPAACASCRQRISKEACARPFIEQHCLECHGEKKAQAGFRIDLLGADFTAAKVAEQWKEVIDRINAGEMPPEGKPRPDAKQAAAFVDWVNEQLREVELAAKNAGGRIPMRRLNRDEYANTVRDLLKLDENIVRPLIEELPGDGKAEGFDRLGVALFFDQTQIERSLAVAEKIAARAIVTEPPKMNHRSSTGSTILRRRPPPEMVEVFPGFTHTIPRGAEDRFVKPDFIEYIQGYPTYRKEYDGWGVIDHFAISQVVTQDGYYRFRIKAKVDNRGRTEPNKFRLQYGMDSPIQAETRGRPRSVGNDRGGPVSARSRQRRSERPAGLSTCSGTTRRRRSSTNRITRSSSRGGRSCAARWNRPPRNGFRKRRWTRSRRNAASWKRR